MAIFDSFTLLSISDNLACVDKLPFSIFLSIGPFAEGDAMLYSLQLKFKGKVDCSLYLFLYYTQPEKVIGIEQFLLIHYEFCTICITYRYIEIEIYSVIRLLGRSKLLRNFLQLGIAGSIVKLFKSSNVELGNIDIRKLLQPNWYRKLKTNRYEKACGKEYLLYV